MLPAPPAAKRFSENRKCDFLLINHNWNTIHLFANFLSEKKEACRRDFHCSLKSLHFSLWQCFLPLTTGLIGRKKKKDEWMVEWKDGRMDGW